MIERAEVNILYASDDKFVPVMGVSITSLFESNKDVEELTVYIAGLDISRSNVKKLIMLAQTYSRRVEIIDASEIDAYLEHLSVSKWKGGKIAWYRCFADRILPNHVDKAIYIDADTIVINSLRELYDFEIGEKKAIGMVQLGKGADYKCIGLPDEADHYVSGVILFDMQRWREMHCEEMLMSAIEKYGNDFYNDEWAINYALHAYIQPISFKYNYESSMYYEQALQHNSNCVADNDMNIAPVIVHFSATNMRQFIDVCSSSHYGQEWKAFKELSMWRQDLLWMVDLSISGMKVLMVRILRRYTPGLLRFVWSVLVRLHIVSNESGNEKFTREFDCESCKRNLPCAVKQIEEAI